VVDTEGLLLRVVVHAADMQDRDGGVLVLTAPLADCHVCAICGLTPATAAASWTGSRRR
jgi:hypothetical protein